MRAHERLLRDIFGVLTMAEDPIRDPERQRRRLPEPLAKLTLEHVLSAHECI
jgi:hypothetical protein